METIVIVNPSSGNGRTKKLWPKIGPELEKSVGSFKTVFTSCRGEAIHLTRKALESGMMRIVAVGGDGLVNEVLNGFFEDDVQINPKAILSFLMTGTGCDFQRSLGFSGDWRKAVVNLKNSKLRKIDVGKVIYTNSQKMKKIRYFLNIASFGLSGAVDFSIENSKNNFLLGGSSLFLWATVKTVFSHPNQTILFSIDGKPEEKIRTRLGLLANGKYFGGGMYAAPEAELDNGLLDLIILKEISVVKFLWHLPKIYTGKHLQIPEIFFQKVQKFTVSSPEEVILDIDGESPGYLEAIFEILPKALNLYI